MTTSANDWPELPLDEWADTYRTLHMWTQVVGKVKLAHAPHVNHWWQTSLHVTPRGLTTAAIPHGTKQLEIAFDFVDHRLQVATSDGRGKELRLEPRSVADFHRELMVALDALDVPTRIWTMPVEVANPVPFEQDETNASYDPDAVSRLHRSLLSASSALGTFRGGFLGKCSPVHFFWGAFDLAVTRFSGRPNPSPPEDPVMREAYSHEVVSHGWWPGGQWPMGGRIESPVFYSYALPEPDGFPKASVSPGAASYDETFGEFLLRQDDLRREADPDAALASFLQSTYEAAATAGDWPRAELERDIA